jgi:hypothetical protein
VDPRKILVPENIENPEEAYIVSLLKEVREYFLKSGHAPSFFYFKDVGVYLWAGLGDEGQGSDKAPN